MDEIVERNSSELMNPKPRIGNIVVNYPGGDTPYHAKPIVMKDGRIVLLTTIMGGVDHNRVVIQELTGEEIKTLTKSYDGNAYCTADEENIYIFKMDKGETYFYVFDAETLELKKDRKIESSIIQNLSCDGENLFTYDIKTNKIQVRDKDGNIRQTKNVPPVHQFFIQDSNGFHHMNYTDVMLNSHQREELESRFGKEFMDYNCTYDDLAYDEEAQTIYVSSNNIVYVCTPQGLKGVMYFQDKKITGIDFDAKTSSLLVSSHYMSDETKLYSSNPNGFVEVIPSDMIDKRIQESSEILESRQHKATLRSIGHVIADLADGDFDVMVYLSEQAKEMGVKIKPVLDDLVKLGVAPNEIRTVLEAIKEDRKKSEITPAQIAGKVWEKLALPGGNDFPEGDSVSGEVGDPDKL